ncbi:MAG: hypothetical protein BGO67_08900 [Alphaproteobacteria bacterium 41-28]|nr:MAG: hypothetical protein BGO67_08900 [Alphaproteobacteria bacterium 41-28]
MHEDTITIPTLYLKRISYKIQELSRFADQLNISAFHLAQLCKDLDEAYQKASHGNETSGERAN